MKFQRKKVATALAYVLGASGAVTLLAGPAQAADIKVEVTGSNIKRIEGEGALPVQVIGREEIAKSGATNAMEIMNLISANNSAGNVSVGNVIGATTFSNQTASLRGLGGSSTLVLVNGKRLGTFAGGISGAEGVNLAAIPFAAIERVEVLKDGASAVYGSDAIGGVINFIMRQDFTGVDVTAWYGAPTRSGGGDQYQFMATVGWGDLTKDKWNAFLSVNYSEQKSLNQNERDFSKTNYIPAAGVNSTSGQTFPGFMSTIGAHRRRPGQPRIARLRPSIVVGTRCRFDPARTARRRVDSRHQATEPVRLGTLPDQHRLAGVLDRPVLESGNAFHHPAHAAVGPDLHDGRRSGDSANHHLQPTSPYYPTQFAAGNGVGGQPLDVRYRCVVCGNRDTTDRTTHGRSSRVPRARRGTGTSTDRSTTARTRRRKSRTAASSSTRRSFVAQHRHRQPVRSDIRRVAAAVNALSYTQEAANSKLSGYGIDIKGSGDIFKLPAGPLALALGLQAGKETLTQNVQPAAASRRPDRLRRQLAGHRPLAYGVGGVRRVEHPDHQDVGSQHRGPV